MSEKPSYPSAPEDGSPQQQQQYPCEPPPPYSSSHQQPPYCSVSGQAPYPTQAPLVGGYPPMSGGPIPPPAGQPYYPPPPPPTTTTYYPSQPAVVTSTVVVTGPAFGFGPNPTNTQCPNCSAQILTETSSSPGTLAWLICVCCVFFGFIFGCCLIPFCINDLQDVEHRCPQCKHYLGTYRRM